MVTRVRPGVRTVALRVTEESYRQIRRAAERRRLTPSEWLRVWIERGLEEAE